MAAFPHCPAPPFPVLVPLRVLDFPPVHCHTTCRTHHLSPRRLPRFSPHRLDSVRWTSPHRFTPSNLADLRCEGVFGGRAGRAAYRAAYLRQPRAVTRAFRDAATWRHRRQPILCRVASRLTGCATLHRAARSANGTARAAFRARLLRRTALPARARLRTHARRTPHARTTCYICHKLRAGSGRRYSTSHLRLTKTRALHTHTHARTHRTLHARQTAGGRAALVPTAPLPRATYLLPPPAGTPCYHTAYALPPSSHRHHALPPGQPTAVSP